MADRFAELVRLINANEMQAAAPLLAEFKPSLCRHVDRQIRAKNIRHLHGASDVFQSVIRSLLSRIAEGKLRPFDSPEHFRKYMAIALRCRVLGYARSNQALKRDGNRVHGEVAEPTLDDLPVETQLLLAELVQNRLSDQAKDVLRMRQDGLTFEEISCTLKKAAQENGASEAGLSKSNVRQQFQKEIESLLKEFWT